MKCFRWYQKPDCIEIWTCSMVNDKPRSCITHHSLNNTVTDRNRVILENSSVDIYCNMLHTINVITAHVYFSCDWPLHDTQGLRDIPGSDWSVHRLGSHTGQESCVTVSIRLRISPACGHLRMRSKLRYCSGARPLSASAFELPIVHTCYASYMWWLFGNIYARTLTMCHVCWKGSYPPLLRPPPPPIK